MTIETQSAHITPISGNIFADMGFEPEESAALQAETQRIIAEKQAIKAHLMSERAQGIDKSS